MQDDFGAHASEEVLERYALDILPEAELASFEEHLLVCSLCQDRLAETETFIRAMRAAARKVEAAPESAGVGWLRQLNLPGRAWIPAVAALAVVLGVAGWWNLWRQPSGPAVAVALHSFRGAGGLVGATAPSGRPLLVRMDLAGVPESGTYEMELVDSQGRGVRRSTLSRSGDGVEAALSSLKRGQYWVRLYRPGSPRELVREFGLKVE